MGMMVMARVGVAVSTLYHLHRDVAEAVQVGQSLLVCGHRLGVIGYQGDDGSHMARWHCHINRGAGELLLHWA